MVIYSNILAWKIPWTEDPGGLQSMGSQRAGHDLSAEQQQTLLIHICYMSKQRKFNRN